MTYDWNAPDPSLQERAAYDQAPRIPEGSHVVRVAKIVTESKKGGFAAPLKNKAGQRYVLAILADSEGRECAHGMPIEPPPGSSQSVHQSTWKLRQFLRALGRAEDATAQKLDVLALGRQGEAEMWLGQGRVRVTVNAKGFVDDVTAAAAKPAPVDDVPF